LLSGFFLRDVVFPEEVANQVVLADVVREEVDAGERSGFDEVRWSRWDRRNILDFLTMHGATRTVLMAV
jgi:hypothetical protein